MKHFVALVVIVFSLSFGSFAQSKVGFVDSDAIMKELPEAQDIKQQINVMVTEWKTELDKKQNEYRAKLDEFERRKLIMSNQKKEEAETELRTLDNEIRQFREAKFGQNGELFKKQEELMKPLQNKLFTAVKEVATEEEFDYIFDRSGGVLMLFAKPDLDMTNKVLEKMK